MEFKDIIGVLILVATLVGGVIDMNRKRRQKQNRAESHPEEVVPSPWDDFMREMAGKQEYSKPEPEEFTYEQEQSYDKPFSYDDQIESEVLTYEPEYAQPIESLRIAQPLQAVQQIKPQPAVAPLQVVQTTDTDEPNQSVQLFPNGFDPKMAVIYSEIMRPRFQEY